MNRREFLARCGAAGTGALPLAALAGCVTRRYPPPRDEQPRPATGTLEPLLRIFNWSDYVAPGTIPRFSREFGVHVVYDTYESNEEMVAKLVAGGGGYDIVVPSGYLVPVLAEGGLLEPLDHNALPNWTNLLPLFAAAPNDPGGRYGMPYQWGMTGLAYRRDLAAPPAGWSVFGDPALRGRMTMLDEAREVIGAMLKWRGHSLNSLDAAELRQAERDALAVKPGLRAYVSAPVKGQLISGDIALAQLWSGDTRQASREEPRIDFVVPAEGSLIFTDYMAIPRGAPSRRAAHAFLNYVMRPDVSAEIAVQTGYGPVNGAALRLDPTLPPAPDPALLQRLEFERDLGAGTDRWDRIWTEIKAA